MSGGEPTTFNSPVLVRPAGTMTVLGLSNTFDDSYPARLKGKVSSPLYVSQLSNSFEPFDVGFHLK